MMGGVITKRDLIFIILFYFDAVHCHRLLAIQQFGAGYPSFHIVRMGNDGSLFCANYHCTNPPHLCKIESISDASRQFLMTTIECIGPRMVLTNRWTIKQRSPNSHKFIDILTEADVTGEINNQRNIERGDATFTDMFHNFEMPIDWNRMRDFDPFDNTRNPFSKPFNPFMEIKGMTMKMSHPNHHV